MALLLASTYYFEFDSFGFVKMPRVCCREGCGKYLVRKNGMLDYHRHFYGTECKNVDKRERTQAKRQQAKAGLCPLCGQPRSKAHTKDRCAASHVAMSDVHLMRRVI